MDGVGAAGAIPEAPLRCGRGRALEWRSVACYCRNLVGREDQQIAALEMLAQCLCLSTWAEEMQGKQVVFFSDNSIAECTFRKGSAKVPDHNFLVHAFWTAVMALEVGATAGRGPSARQAVLRWTLGSKESTRSATLPICPVGKSDVCCSSSGPRAWHPSLRKFSGCPRASDAFARAFQVRAVVQRAPTRALHARSR